MCLICLENVQMKFERFIQCLDSSLAWKQKNHQSYTNILWKWLRKPPTAMNTSHMSGFSKDLWSYSDPLVQMALFNKFQPDSNTGYKSAVSSKWVYFLLGVGLLTTHVSSSLNFSSWISSFFKVMPFSAISATGGLVVFTHDSRVFLLSPADTCCWESARGTQKRSWLKWWIAWIVSIYKHVLAGIGLIRHPMNTDTAIS